WLDCTIGPNPIPQDPCQKPIEAVDIRLRILLAPVRNFFPDTPFWFAIAPALATVYYESVLGFAKYDQREFEAPIVLGCVIAHEIGHLLLGSKSHSFSGVMRSRWDREQIREATMGGLLFTPKQGRLMQAEMHRQGQEGGGSSDKLAPITIRVDDYAHSKSNALPDAERTASALLSKAGVEVVWLSHLTDTAQPFTPMCAGGANPTQLTVRILPDSMSRRWRSADDTLGFAAVRGQKGCDAWVFYDRVNDLAVKENITFERLLGAVIVHELGHLLLGENGHPRTGLM